jgi:sulfite reductase (NADPH) flavoprotein alpha-component
MFGSAAEIFEELKQAANPKTGIDIRGASHERLRLQPLQWPIAPEPDRVSSAGRPADHGSLSNR